MVKCEGVTYGYTKYVQFIHSNNIVDDSWIEKMLSPTREVDNDFL